MRHAVPDRGRYPSQQGLASARREAPQRPVASLNRSLLDLPFQGGFFERTVARSTCVSELMLELSNTRSHRGGFLQKDCRVGIGHEQVAGDQGRMPGNRLVLGQAVNRREDMLPDRRLREQFRLNSSFRGETASGDCPSAGKATSRKRARARPAPGTRPRHPSRDGSVGA
jgi:hypothetical protein